MGIKQPPEYIYPKKRKRPAAETEPQITTPVEPVRAPIKKKRETRSDTSIPSGQCVQLRLVIPSPAAGQLQLHDEMIAAGYTSKQALLGLLKKGFDRFEAELLADKIAVPADPLETNGKPVDTTRNVSPQFFEKAKALFDPFDVLSDRAFGQRIGDAIIRTASKGQ